LCKKKIAFMKTIMIALAGICICGLLTTACTTKAHPHGMPPGQAKKISGSQSAAPFAPGQQKKLQN
jgi:ABC-type phosphate transport system substrate-binding protein